jgi:hypothetical protein
MLRCALFALAVLFAAPVMTSAPAQAQLNQSFVSSSGSDANLCIASAPCLTFHAAIARTNPEGQVSCLTPGNFGAVEIDKSLMISCPPGFAQIISGAAGIPGVVIDNASGVINVTLDGLTINGLGTGFNGVKVIGNAKVLIRNSIIQRFTQPAVLVAGPAGARVFIEDSMIAGNPGGGVSVEGIGGAANAAILIRATLDNNLAFGTRVAQPSVMVLDGSRLTGSAASIVNVGGATVTSLGNNYINGSGLPTLTIATK